MVEGEVFDAKTDKGKVDSHSKCNKQEAEKVVSLDQWYREFQFPLNSNNSLMR